MATAATFTRRWRTDGFALLAAVVVLGLTALVATQGVSSFEATIFHAINDLPEFLYRPMWLAQFLGLLLAPAIVAVVALGFRRWRLALALLLLIPLKLFIEKGIVKNLVYRARPGTSICNQDPNCLNLRDAQMVGPSFPSGHVIIACGIAWLVAPYVGPKWRYALVGICCAVGFARVYLGAHNPLDVVAGAACGVTVGALLNLLIGVPARSS